MAYATEIKGWQKDPTIARIVRATFPSYRRKTVYVRACESVSLQDLNWSGGTRAEYRACTIDGQPLGSLARFNAMAPWDARQVEGQSLPLVAGAVVVQGGHFCGKESALRLHVHPSDMPRYLPAPPVATPADDIAAHRADYPEAR